MGSSADIAIIGGAVYGGKALALSTPIPTPSGWTTMGGLCVGDLVLSADGTPTTVVTATPAYDPVRLYDVRFADGSVIRADGEHLWLTSTSAARISERNARHRALAGQVEDSPWNQSHLRRRPSIVTTEQIRQTLTAKVGRSVQWNHAVRVADPIELPRTALPIDPYVLGAWLGDGTAREGAITCADQEILDQIVAAGFELTKWSGEYTWGIRGLTAQLTKLGLRNRKRIPAIYLRASYEDRLALAQGLMDTDGTINAIGQMELSLSDPLLAGDCHELLLTLGIRTACRRGDSMLRGHASSDRYRMKFRTGLPLFRLHRKAVKIQKHSNLRSKFRAIVAVDPVPPEPVRCIGIDHPSRLFLASRSFIPTHNTWSLTIEPLRHVSNPGFRAVTFRRVTPEIRNPGGMWDESMVWYPHLGGIPVENVLEWTFPSGAVVKFAGLQHDKDVLGWKGAQVALIQFDQLEEFSENQFWYLLSRNRSTCGVIPYVRASANPDPDSWLRKFVAWWIDDETGYAIPERSGVLRWFLRVNNELVWADSRDALIERFGESGARARSVTFVLARLQDNKIGQERDPNYEAAIRALPTVEQERLLGGDRGGNWNIRAAAGLVFDRSRFEIVDAAPAVAKRVRAWDKAATPGAGDGTAGVRMAITPDGICYIEDVVWGQWASGDRQSVELQVAQLDGRTIPIRMEQEPGSSGKDVAASSVQRLAGYDIVNVPSTGSKLVRAGPFAAQVKAGNVKLVRGPWNEPYLKEMHAFPTTGVPDDRVDATTLAYNQLTLQPKPTVESRRIIWG